MNPNNYFKEAFANVNVDEIKTGFFSFMGKVGDKMNEFASGLSLSEEIGVSYITPRIIAMIYPSSKRSIYGIPARDLPAWMNKRHKGKYMIWNLSDKSYDNSIFQDQVIEYKFPGYPAPPLDKIFSICQSIDSWLRADVTNIAVVHCQTGKGRTMTAIACYLGWSKQFQSALAALEHIEKVKGMSLEELLIPSQIRYVNYFDRLLKHDYPNSGAVRIERIIVNTVPNFMNGRSLEDGGCRPYIQIFKHAELIYSSASKENPPKWCKFADGSLLFTLGIDVQGDVLIRCRNVGHNNQRMTMFRLGFHSGYLVEGISRFAREEVDGTGKDECFDKEFFIDVVTSCSASSVDEKTHDIDPSEYWKTVMHRDAKKTHQLSLTERRFSLFGEEAPDDFFGLEDEHVSHNSDSFADLEKYVQGLDDLNVDDYEVDSDTDGILDQLKNELEDSVEEDGDGDETLDDEVARMLAEAEDTEDDDQDESDET